MDIPSSTPLITDKTVQLKPRKLLPTISPVVQWNKSNWAEYRSPVNNKDKWNNLDSPLYVDFKNPPDINDNYFDNVEEENNSTPERFKMQQCLPVSDLGNTFIKNFQKCTMLSRQLKDRSEANDTIIDKSTFDETLKHVCPTIAYEKTKNSPKIKENVETANIEEASKCHEEDDATSGVFKKHRIDAKVDIIRKASIGSRANSQTNDIKVREGISSKLCPAKDMATVKNNNKTSKNFKTTEIWNKKPFQPKYEMKLPIASKAPKLATAIRAKERQRFEEDLRTNELIKQQLVKEREAARKKSEKIILEKLRQQLVHKAQPIRKYKALPNPKKRELTEPITPKVSKRPRKL